jgi:DNA helicase-2/ATP-dependent DNA helicase PcrA
MAGKKLNREQRSAVNSHKGPLLIIAGAGTGKTTVITEKILRIIEKGYALPEEILALTFTEKSASEMETRVDKELPLGYSQTWIMTFHSFCDRVLREEGLHIGLNTNYRIIKDADRLGLLKKHIFGMDLDYYRPIGNPNKFLLALLNHFDRLHDENVSPEEYLSWSDSLPSEIPTTGSSFDKEQSLELAKAFTFYEELKIKNDLLDFSDLVKFTLKLFRSRPNVLARYQKKFKFLLIDEYQDTNFSQNLLVDLLAQKHHNLTVVADDDQSIYRWRGAAISNVIQFRKRYPSAKLVVLSKNYRSSQEILDSAYKLIQHNNPDRLEISEKISKKLKSANSLSGPPPTVLHFLTLSEEVRGVVQEIKSLVNKGYSPRDIAILVRANTHAYPFLSALEKEGIPCQFQGSSKLFSKTEVKDLICYLRLLLDPEDNQLLYRILSLKYFNFSQLELSLLTNFSQKNNSSLFNTLNNIDKQDQLVDDPTRQRLKTFLDLFKKHIEETRLKTPGQVLFSFLKDTGIMNKILNPDDSLDADAATNITSFFNRLKAFELENPDAKITDTLNWIDLSIEAGESPNGSSDDYYVEDAVNILTVHSAKGLEFPIVFIVNLVSQRFPTTEKKEPIPVPEALIKEVLPSGDAHLQEERRLFYVAMTRAKERLYLTAADFYGDGKRAKKISQFISESIGSGSFIPAPATLQQTTFGIDPDSESKASPAISKKEFHEVTYLNYSRIQSFLDCPLHYKAKYILNISSPPTAASTFGNTIHAVLKKYYQSLLQNEKPDILKILSQEWTDFGYSNIHQARLYRQKGEQFLEGFIKSGLLSTTPIKLEDPFTFTLDSGLRIGGKIDRAGLTSDGTLEIIDYKTGAHKLDEKEAKKDLQLSIYALAASRIPYPPYGKLPEEISLKLYYFDTQEIVQATRSREDLESAEQILNSYASQISQSDFQCSKSIICHGKCDYKDLCDLTFA